VEICPSRKGHPTLLPHLWVWGAHQEPRQGLPLGRGGTSYLVFQQPSWVPFSPKEGQGGVPSWCPWRCTYSTGSCQDWAGGQERKHWGGGLNGR